MTGSDIQNRRWFRELVAQVETELSSLQSQPDRRQALEREHVEIERKCRGWLQSLGDPELDSRLRSSIQEQYRQALERQQGIESELTQLNAAAENHRSLVDADRVAAELNRLETILNGGNASAGNLLLSQHIEGIYCDQDGRVVIRTCKLGALAGAIDLLSSATMDASRVARSDAEGAYVATPRTRARLDVGLTIENEDEIRAANQFAVDPFRFAGLGAEWFTGDVFQVPTKKCWAERHAREVAEFRLTEGATMEATAEEFNVSVPTIRKSLKFALELGLDAFGKKVSVRTRRIWARDEALRVDAYVRQQRCTIQEAAAHFGKCPTTIGKALEYAATMTNPAEQGSPAELDSAANDGTTAA